MSLPTTLLTYLVNLQRNTAPPSNKVTHMFVIKTNINFLITHKCMNLFYYKTPSSYQSHKKYSFTSPIKLLPISLSFSIFLQHSLNLIRFGSKNVRTDRNGVRFCASWLDSPPSTRRDGSGFWELSDFLSEFQFRQLVPMSNRKLGRVAA